MGSFLTWAAIVVPLILALITLIRMIIKVIRRLIQKCNIASLETPSRVIKDSGEPLEMCGCGRVDTKDPHMLIKPPLEVPQIINDVNINQRHVHSNGITIVCLHPKCKISPLMALTVISIACLLNPVGAEILVPRMQIRGERSGWRAVRLKAEPPSQAVTKHYLWTLGRTGRISDIRIAPAQDCVLSTNPEEDATFLPPVSSLLQTRMEIICRNKSELIMRGTLYRNRNMSVELKPPIPCLRHPHTETEAAQISRCVTQPFNSLLNEHTREAEELNLYCFNVSLAPTTFTRAMRDNAYLRPTCTALEVEWVWWDGQKTWSLLSDERDVAAHLRSQSLEIRSELNDCLTDHCVAVGRHIFSKFNNTHSSRTKREIADESFYQSESQRWSADRQKYCPYENSNRQVLKIGDKRYDGGYTCEDYMDEWVVNWNSYARFAADVIDFQNRTAYDVLELYKLTNATVGVVEELRKRAIKFAQDLHAAEIRRTREFANLNLEVRMGLSIAEQRSTLSNALSGILHSTQMEANAWSRFVQWHTAAGQCVTDRCEHLNNLLNIDAGILTIPDERQPPPIVEKWLPTEVAVIGFDAQYNQTAEILTLCSIPYSIRRGCENGKCKECLEQEAWCARGRIERNLVVIAELRATSCRGRQDTAEWILIPTAEDAMLSDGRYAGCINVTFDGVFPLPWSTCFGTTRVAQWISPLPTRYIPQEQRSLVLVSTVATWSLPAWASGNDELANTLREVQQRANARAEAVTDWISEQVSARQTLDYESNKGVINQISTVSQGAHPLSVVALAIALVAVIIAIATFVSVHPMLRLMWEATMAVLKRSPLLCAFSKLTESAQPELQVITALKGKHKRIEYRARLARNNTLETLDSLVTLVLHTSGKARLDYGPQQITEFVYGPMRRGILITDVVKCATTSCDCTLNDDLEVALNNPYPVAPANSPSSEQVNNDATP